MAPSERHPLTVLDPRTQAAIARARETGFFALISALERLQPSAERVGGYGPVAQEALRFRNDPSMGFAASDVSDAAIIKVEGAGGRSREVVEVTTTFLGLTGSVSPLPLHIPAEVAQEGGPRNVQRDFLDIFHHRLISLLYRLWTRYQIAREHLSDSRDAWSPRLLALGGFDAYDASGALPIPPGELLRLMPLLVWRARPARSLQLALQSVLREDLVPNAVTIDQLTGGFVALDDSARMRLGGATAVLGRTALLGTRANDRASGFAIGLRLRAGSDATRYMSGGDRLDAMRRLVAGLLHEALDFDVNVEVEPGATTAFALDGRAPLGRRTFLRGRGVTQRFSVRNVATQHERPNHAG